MEANVWQVGEIFYRGGDIHYVLPRFQRAYAWGEEEWQTLWDDLLAMCAEERAGAEHFLGAMVVIRKDTPGSHIPTYSLVDGQQRLLTISLILLALTEQLGADGSFSEQVRSYLVNRFGTGDMQFKVLPTQHNGDRNEWTALVTGDERLEANRSRIPDALKFYRQSIRQVVERQLTTPKELFDTLTSRLFLVFINLNREERPHQIFESLNAKGIELSQADLVRNYIAMRLMQSDQERAFDQYWMPIQQLLDDQKELPVFLRHYLARVMRLIVNEREIYREFRKRMDLDFQGDDALVGELQRLYRHAGFYDRLLRPQNEPNELLRKRFERIRTLQRTVVYPLLLSFQDLHDRGALSLADFCEALDILENFLVRHYLVDLSTGALNRIMPTLISINDQDVDLQALKRGLHKRQYPGDDRICYTLDWIGMYGGGADRRRLIYTLMRINNHLLQDGDVIIDLASEPSVEHIMPRTLSRAWQSDLGPEWEQDHRDLLDTIGNLTLMTKGWNSSASNRPWSEKRAQLLGHKLPLNTYWFGIGRPGASVQHWNRKSIKERNKWLVECILEIWPDLGESGPKWDPERDPSPYIDYTGKGVASLSLHGNEFHIYFHSWNNCAVLFTNQVAVTRQDFENVAEQLPEYINRDKGNRQLDNGWWLTSMGANQAAGYLIELASLCDLDDQDWYITLNR